MLILVFFALAMQSCFKDSDDAINNDLVGSWQLVEWSIGEAFDINADGAKNVNLLYEIDCPNEELLLFDTNGIVTSDKTYNPTVEISRRDGSADDYNFNIECPDGTIGFSADYSQNNATIIIQDLIATRDGNTLTRVFENAINIYNEDFSQIIGTRNLTMVYSKL